MKTRLVDIVHCHKALRYTGCHPARTGPCSCSSLPIHIQYPSSGDCMSYCHRKRWSCCSDPSVLCIAYPGWCIDHWRRRDLNHRHRSGRWVHVYLRDRDWSCQCMFPRCRSYQYWHDRLYLQRQIGNPCNMALQHRRKQLPLGTDMSTRHSNHCRFRRLRRSRNLHLPRQCRFRIHQL